MQCEGILGGLVEEGMLRVLRVCLHVHFLQCLNVLVSTGEQVRSGGSLESCGFPKLDYLYTSY